MATFSGLFVVAVLPAFFVTVLGRCESEPCLKPFILIGTDSEFCTGLRRAVTCAETTLLNNRECEAQLPVIRDTLRRGKQIISCYPCGGNYTTTSPGNSTRNSRSTANTTTSPGNSTRNSRSTANTTTMSLLTFSLGLLLTKYFSSFK